ncbi:MAG TPA: MBOAT family O-acyltransferase [Candidatus Cloacimonas acidaminovorans]|nr:MBOAT family O-acyltransferase [Candidatus Cloacimonas acidaminovorans]
MLFNSIDFAVFLPIVFVFYWFVFNKNIKIQNLFLVVASYVFYGWWDWRFLFLIALSSFIDFFVGILLSKTDIERDRRRLLLVSIAANIGILGFFKYYNFFYENFATAFTFLGFSIKSNTLKIILPVGISFYTFQTMSYTIDVYRNKLTPTKDIIAFSAYVSFFPQLVAGPIERATNLLPQFYRTRSFDFDNSKEGLRQILWGFFKKVVIADNCAEIANLVFNNSADYSGSTLLLGVICFAFQIYGDFSGYSDIAIGTAKLFGFNLMRNFAYPYFSRDIAEFWRRWHISLSTWFRDYIYIPMGGSRGTTWRKIKNTIIIFTISGFWHGANWTFIVWGFLNAVYFLPLILTNKNRINLEIVAKHSLFPTLKEFFQILLTFLLTLVAWIFFRSESLMHAFVFLKGMFSVSLFSLPHFSGIGRTVPIAFLLTFMIALEWFNREKEFALSNFGANRTTLYRWSFYSLIVFMIGMHMQTNETPFIYFQF